MRFSKTTVLSCTVLALTSAGCSDQLPSDVSRALPTQATNFQSATFAAHDPVSSREREAAALIAQSIARAMGDPAVRSYMKAAFASSGVAERKLDLSSFLAGRGGELLGGISRSSGHSLQAFRDAIASVRSLEFYMPVRAHRESWDGTVPPLVAVAASEADELQAFDHLGTPRWLDPVHPPTEPVVVLVPAEADFRAQIAFNARGIEQVACTPGFSESLESAARRCHDDTPSTSPELSPLDLRSDGITGLYATEISLFGDPCGGECWWMGDPEYEISVLAELEFGDFDQVGQIQCASEREADPRNYNAASHWAGKVQILSLANLEAIMAHDSTWVLTFWENDVANCELYYDEPLNSLLLHAVGGFLWAWAWTLSQDDPRTRDIDESNLNEAFAAFLAGSIATYYGFRSLFMGGDDFLGVGVERTKTPLSSGRPSRFNVMIVNQRATRLVGEATTKLFDANGPYIGPVTTIALSTAGHPDKMPVNGIKTYVALAYDQYHTPVPDKTASWQSSNPSVASVDSYGAVSGLSLGTATITATIDGVVGSRSVEVVNVGAPVSLAVKPLTLTLNVGQQGQMVARLYDANGFEVPGSANFAYRWSSSAPSSCSVFGEGLVFADATPGASIRAEHEGLTATAKCTVRTGDGTRK